MRYFVILFVILTVSMSSQAQYFDKTYSVAIDINAPLSNKDYIDQISLRGIKLGYREMINERFFGGVDFTNYTYSTHQPRQTYSNGTSAVTTDLFNYAYAYGLTLSGEYFFKIEQRIMPYAGLGFGASYINYRQFYNVYSSQSDSWGVLIRPQFGVLLRLKESSNWAFQTGVHYDFSSAKSSDFGLDVFHNLGLQMGIIFLSW